MTPVYGVIGDPVSHSFSPYIHRHFAAICGFPMEYLPFHVKHQDLPAAIEGARALGIRGLNITLPHKQAVMPLLSRIDPLAAAAGAVNTLVLEEEGYAGYNTDISGIIQSVKMMGLSLKQKKVIIFGAGGGAYAACTAAAVEGAGTICIINRSRERAESLEAHINRNFSITACIYSYDEMPDAGGAVIIQTTTLGFGTQKDRTPLESISFLRAAELAFDLIYTPWETVFLRQARSAGVPAVNGFPMLVYQAAASFGIWNERNSIHVSTLTSPEQLEILSGAFRSRHNAD